MKTQLSREAIQELVAAAIPRDVLVVSQTSTPVRLETIIVGPDPDRWVRVWIGPYTTFVFWLKHGRKDVDRQARQGRAEGRTSLDALNLIRTACAWLIEDTLPPWPDLSRPWEWDDPDVGCPSESVARLRDDCGDDPKGGA